jgi:hypothetical protein
MYIASAWDFRGYNWLPSGLVMTNGSFEGYLSRLEVGSSRYSGIYDCYNNGILDLRSTTLKVLSVTGEVWIGSAPLSTKGGSLSYKQCRGRVHLPVGTASFNTNLFIGDTNYVNGTSDSYGLLELQGTRVTVGGQVLLDNTGYLTNHVQGLSCGLDILSNDTNSFRIRGRGRMHLAFDSNPVDTGNAYYGLRMSGDQSAYFQSLAATTNLTWNTNALAPFFVKRFGIFYDTKADKTYVGVGQLTTPGIVVQAL